LPFSQNVFKLYDVTTAMLVFSAVGYFTNKHIAVSGKLSTPRRLQSVACI